MFRRTKLVHATLGPVNPTVLGKAREGRRERLVVAEGVRHPLAADEFLSDVARRPTTIRLESHDSQGSFDLASRGRSISSEMRLRYGLHRQAQIGSVIVVLPLSLEFERLSQQSLLGEQLLDNAVDLVHPLNDSFLV